MSPSLPPPQNDPATHCTAGNTPVQHGPPSPHVAPAFPASPLSLPISTSKPLPPPTSPTASSPPTPPPSGRWECLYVYAFLIKFLPPMVKDLYDAVGFEQALQSIGFNQILFDILVKFLLQLRPPSDDPITPENVTEILARVVVQLSKTRDRTVWWDEFAKVNVHPFTEDVADFFAMTWQDKLVMFRQLVDWQLALSGIKDVIDVAWDVTYQRKKKKTNKTVAAEFAPPDADDPMSFANLRMVPLGQDTWRTRYWMIDNSPRVWSSPNPWRMNCPITSMCSTRDEFCAFVESIRSSLPPLPPHGGKRPKYQLSHLELITALEGRFTMVDAEQLRVEEEKANRIIEKEREEEEQIAALEEEERRKLEICSRTRSKTKTDAVDELMDLLDDNAEAGSSTGIQPKANGKSKGKAKARASNGGKKASKKRKRPASLTPPGNPDEIDELADDDDEGYDYDAAAPQVPTPVPSPKGKETAKGGAGKRKSLKKEPVPEDKDGEKKTTKSKGGKKDPEDKPTEEKRSPKKGPTKAVKSEPKSEPTEAAPSANTDKRNNARTSTASRGVKEDGTAESTSSTGTGSRPKNALSHRAIGSRRSSRLAPKEEEASLDDQTEVDAASEPLVPPLQSTSLEDDDPRPRKKTKVEVDEVDDHLASKSPSQHNSEDTNMDVDSEVFSSTVTVSPAEMAVPGTKASEESTGAEAIPTSPLPSKETSAVVAPHPATTTTIVNGWAVHPQSSETPQRPVAAQSQQRICA